MFYFNKKARMDPQNYKFPWLFHDVNLCFPDVFAQPTNAPCNACVTLTTFYGVIPWHYLFLCLSVL